MKYDTDRYHKYKQALYTATHDTDFMLKHPDFALCHARVFYDDLKHEGYVWYPDNHTWSKTPPKQEQPKPPKESPLKGIPASELFKVRIIAPGETIGTLVATTVQLYEMADCVLLRKSTARTGRWTGEQKIVYMDFRLPG